MEVLSGHGRPSKYTKGLRNQYYKDVDTGDIYICKLSNDYSTIHHAPVGGYLWRLVHDVNPDIEGAGDIIDNSNALDLSNYVTLDDSKQQTITGEKIFKTDYAVVIESKTERNNKSSVIQLSTGTYAPGIYLSSYMKPGISVDMTADSSGIGVLRAKDVSKSYNQPYTEVRPNEIRMTSNSGNASVYTKLFSSITSSDATLYVNSSNTNGGYVRTKLEGVDLIIPSSTEGSTKRFKITVDDSGTLSASEVT